MDKKIAKKKREKSATVRVERRDIEETVHVIRGQRVMLDFDLARLYGVTTSALNQAVKRNVDRFPEDFMFQLSQSELENWRSQIVISNPAAKMGLRRPPYAFTENGVAMLSSVVKSSTAVRVNIEIMRTFVRLRRLMATPGELVEQLQKLTETVQLHDDQIKTIIRVLQQMSEKPEAPRRKIGFRTNPEKDDPS